MKILEAAHRLRVYKKTHSPYGDEAFDIAIAALMTLANWQYSATIYEKENANANKETQKRL